MTPNDILADIVRRHPGEPAGCALSLLEEDGVAYYLLWTTPVCAANQHRLRVDVTPPERLLAHWTGFIANHANAALPGIRRVSKPGLHANPDEKRTGQVVHAVASGHSVFESFLPALCHARPTGRLGWTDHCGGEGHPPADPLPTITCPKCRKALGLD